MINVTKYGGMCENVDLSESECENVIRHLNYTNISVMLRGMVDDTELATCETNCKMVLFS